MRIPMPSFAMALAALLTLPALADEPIATRILSDEADSSATAPYEHWELGAVTDVRRTDDQGIAVLAVTPGGAAERIGLRVNDRLRAINGRTLAGASQPNQELRDALAGSGGRIRLEVLRDGGLLTLSGSLDGGAQPASASVPTGDGCGYVSTIDAPPRMSEFIFHGRITMIDGVSTALFPTNRHRLSVGRHVLVVSENIDEIRFSDTQKRHRSLMQRYKRKGAYKALVVDIETDTRYSIGARLLRDRMDNESIRNNEYWEPVVWGSRPEPCSP